MKDLNEKLKQLTDEFMATNCKNSHKRTRLFLEMQEVIRMLKTKNLRRDYAEIR